MKLTRGFVVVVVVIAWSALAHGRGLTRIDSRIDLTTARVTPMPSGSIPQAPVATSTPVPHASISITGNTVHVVDVSGVDHPSTFGAHAIAWSVAVGGTIIADMRMGGGPSGNEEVRAYGASGALSWNRTHVSIMNAFDVDGAVALASAGRVEIAEAATGATRCLLVLANPASWPVAMVRGDPTLFVYYTTTNVYAFNPATCALRWSLPSNAATVHLVHRGKLYDVISASRGTPGSGTVSVLERDLQTGAVGRTFVAASYGGFFDTASARLVAVGNDLYVESEFVALD